MILDGNNMHTWMESYSIEKVTFLFQLDHDVVTLVLNKHVKDKPLTRQH